MGQCLVMEILMFMDVLINYIMLFKITAITAATAITKTTISTMVGTKQCHFRKHISAYETKVGLKGALQKQTESNKI